MIKSSSYHNAIHVFAYVIALFVTCFSFSVFAEEDDSPSRPKTALVLSGGGARGLAHVGVVKALNEMRIPYDCIAGTSMGAIAGGTFASGTTVTDAERMVVDADWKAVFSDKPRRSDIPYFRKYEDYKPYFDFSLVLDGLKLKTPKNFVGVQHIGLFFRELAGARVEKSFDDLPIPFRAVGTDIITGKPVVIQEGSLAEAMRASMSIPSIFPPIPYKEHLLVDGGLSMNLPVEIGRSLCGKNSRVIAVDVSTPGYQQKDLNSFFSIAEQVITISMQPNMEAQKALLHTDDVLINPELKGYSSTDFERVSDLVRIGEEAVQHQKEALAHFQVSETDYAKWQEAINAKRRKPLVIDQVDIKKTKWVNQAVLQDLLKVEPGISFSMKKLHKNISQVYARGDFSSIRYDLSETSPGHADIAVVPEEKGGRDFVRFGFGLYTDFQGDAQFNAIASLRRAWLNRLDAEWRTDLRLGRDYGIETEWYQPASLGSEFFVAPFLRLQTNYHDIYTPTMNKFEYRQREEGGGVEMGSVFGRWGEVRVGVLRTHVSTNAITLPSIANQSIQKGGYTLRSTYDQLDSVHFPHQGASAQLSYFHSDKNIGADTEYNRLDFHGVKAFTKGQTTVLVAAHVADDLGSTLPYHESFSLGGLFNVSAYPSNYFQGGRLRYASLLAYRKVSELPSVIGRGIYAGAALEAGRMERAPAGFLSMNEAIYAGSAYLAADTVVGPFYLLVSAGSQNQAAAYMALGINF